MCMRCVRADRREAEGRPARWQQPHAVVAIRPDAVGGLLDGIGRARYGHDLRYHEVRLPDGRTVRTDGVRRPWGPGRAVPDPGPRVIVLDDVADPGAGPTAAEVERGTDVSRFIRGARVGRGA